jgi:hypothetical protein
MLERFGIVKKLFVGVLNSQMALNIRNNNLALSVIIALECRGLGVLPESGK